MSPKVSVIVPCYNGASWLATAVQSVLSQEYSCFELLLTDDASTDDSLEIANGAAVRDSRVTILSSEQNQGMTRNWNVGLSAAKGDFVCKLDCDDAWEPGTLGALVGAFERRPDLTAAFCRTTQCDAHLNPTGFYLGDQAFFCRGLDPNQDLIRPAAEWYEWCFDDIQLWHSNAFMIRRSTLSDTLGGWDQRFGCASDTDLILRILELGGEVAHLGHIGVRYRSTSGSVSATGRQQGWVSVEGHLACALSLQRTAERRKLSGHLELQRSRYLAALHTCAHDAGYHSPERLASGHQELFASVIPISLRRRLVWQTRCWLSGLIRGAQRHVC